MYETISRLETVSVDLKCAKSLLGFMSDFFTEINPDVTLLMTRYDMYGDMLVITHKTIHDSLTELERIIDEQCKQERGKK